MLKSLYVRLKQKYRTISFPKGKPQLPPRFRSFPVIAASQCSQGCRECIQACPTDALISDEQGLRVDLGKCIFCTTCMETCPQKIIHYSREYSLSARNRSDLIVQGEAFNPVQEAGEKIKSIFGRSLKLRQVSAGGCNACEQDTNVLNTIVFDLGRFGIQFVASPRHADGILVTGPVTENMKIALKKTYDAIPAPKIVIAVGACAISGGIYASHSQVHNGIDSLIPVDLYIPGCPPHPLTILDGLLRFLGKSRQDREK